LFLGWITVIMRFDKLILLSLASFLWLFLKLLNYFVNSAIIKQLYEQIGQLSVERDWLKKSALFGLGN